MINKIKYLIYGSCTLALLMGSCSPEDSDPQDTLSDELVFVTSQKSRSEESTTDNLTQKSFAVYGDVCLSTGEGNLTQLMNCREATYSSDSKKWNYGTTIYWFTNHIHSFVALHPLAAINKTKTVSNVKYSNGQLSFRYSHPQNYKDASDLLVATHRRQYDQILGKSEDPVSFKFEHILSVLDIRIMYYEELAYNNYNNRIEITQIVLDGINISGTYSVRPDDLTPSNARSGTDAHNDISGWSDLSSGSATFKGDTYNEWNTGHMNQCSIEPDASKPVFKPVFKNKDALTVLPKASGDVQLSLTFKLFVNGTYAADHTLYTVLKNAEWKAGQKIIYNLQVSVGEILQGGCTIEDWNSIDDLNEIISDVSSDHDAGTGVLNGEDWSDFENKW